MREDKLPKLVPDVLEKLSNGFSRQNKAATGYWITLAIVSTFTVIPEPIGNMLSVPFLPGLQMSSTSYYPFACILLSVLLLGYASANVQVIRTRRLVQRYIGHEEQKGRVYIVKKLIHIQDVFDSITTPSIGRVAPLAQILQGRNQFYPEGSSPDGCRRAIAVAYFIVLRVVGILIIEAFPGFALATAIQKGSLLSATGKPWGIPAPFFWFVTAVGFVILFQLLYLDISYGIGSVKRIVDRTGKSNK